MVGQPLCLVAGARARGGWRVVLDDARGAAGSLRASLGSGASRESADVACCAFSFAKAAWRKNIKDAGREASCSSYTSPRRAGDRSAVCLGFVVRVCVCSFARADLSVFAGAHE